MRSMIRFGATALLLSVAACGSDGGPAPSLVDVNVVPVGALALAPGDTGTTDPMDGVNALRVAVTGPGMTEKAAVYNVNDGSGALPEFEGGFSRQVTVELCTGSCNAQVPGDVISRGRTGRITLFRGDNQRNATVFVSRRNSIGLPAKVDPEGSGLAVSSEMVQPTRVGATMTELDDGRVLIVGGAKPKLGARTWFNAADLDTIYSDAEIFDPRTGEFTAVGNLNAGRAFHQAVKLGGPNRTDGRVVILGGFAGQGGGIRPTNTIEIFNPDNGEFVQLTETLPGGAGRALFTAVLAYPDQQGIFIAGGVSEPAVASSTWALLVVQLQGVTGPVANGDLVGGPRWNHSVAHVPNYGGLDPAVPAFILFGGENDAGVVSMVEPFIAQPAPDFNFAQMFVPDTTAQPSLPIARTMLQSVYVPQQGIVYLIGGFAGKDLANPSNRVDAYWVGERNFRDGQYLELAAARGAATATLMDFNTILIAGGVGDGGAMSSTEVLFEDTVCQPKDPLDPQGPQDCYYTPRVAGERTPQLVDASGSAQARTGHLALFDGTRKLLLVGGVSNAGSALPALYYNPD